MISNGDAPFIYGVEVLPMRGGPFASEFKAITFKRSYPFPRGDLAELAKVNRHGLNGDDYR